MKIQIQIQKMKNLPASLFAISLAAATAAGCHPAAQKRPKAGPQAGLEVHAAPPPLTGHNLLYNESFNQGPRSLPWNGEISSGAQGRTFVENGELCMEVKKNGPARWDT